MNRNASLRHRRRRIRLKKYGHILRGMIFILAGWLFLLYVCLAMMACACVIPLLLADIRCLLPGISG